MIRNVAALPFFIIICASSLLFTHAADAAQSHPRTLNGLWQQFTGQVSQTWQQPQHTDFYLPAITWHNRLTYDREHIDRYNERPWGAGGGISRFDDNGNWNGIYLMAFKDSFNKWEPIGGYGWEKIWRPVSDTDFRLGLGYTAGVTMRDNWD